MNIEDEDTPVVPLDARMEIEQLRAQLEALRVERKRLVDRDELLKLYEMTLKVSFGHLVELIRAGQEWRRTNGDKLATERLQAAVDRASAVEAERAVPPKCQKTGVHEFVNDVCRHCGLEDD